MNKESLLKISPAKEEDSIFIWHWRNDLETRMMSKNKKIIDWEEHTLWFKKKIISKESEIYIFKEEKIPVGVIIFNKLNRNKFEISINLNPEFRGKGYGNILLKKGLINFKKNNKSNYKIIATIKATNIKSQNIFKKNMFKLERRDEKFLYFSLQKKD